MTYRCEKCGREWDDQLAVDNELQCTRKCGGRLMASADVAEAECCAPAMAGAVAHFPSLLAIPLAEYYEEEHPVMRLHRLVDVVELLTRFSAIVALGELRGELRQQPLPQDLLKEIQPSIERPTFGQWRKILNTLLDHFQDIDSLVVPELPVFTRDFLLPALSDGMPNLPEKGLVALRNLLAHGGAQPWVWAEERLQVIEPWMDQAIERLEFLAEVHVCFYKNGCALELTDAGKYPPKRALSDVLQKALGGLNAHVVLFRGDRWLDLWPLCDYGRASSSSLEGRRETVQDVSLIYSRADRARLLYYTVLGGSLPQAERNRQDHPDLLREFRQLFRLEDRVEDETGTSRPVDFEAEIQADAAALVGREAELKQVKAQIKAAQSGVFWLHGPGGIGKSYLMARLAKDLRGAPNNQCRIAWRFKTSDQERCSRTAFLRHAVTRLADWLKKVDYTPERESDRLYKQLQALLIDVSGLKARDPRGRPPRVLFLLDGLDEIERLDGDFPNVPLSLVRDNVVWLCAGRPEGRLPEVFSPDRATQVFPAREDHPEGGLPAMSDQDIRAMLLNRTESLKYELLSLDEPRQEVDENGQTQSDVGNPAVEAVIQRARGLPLYVHLVIEDILAGHFRFDELQDRLPPTLSDYYDDLLRRLSIGELQALLTPLVVTIAWAKSPLDERTLHLLMARRRVVGEGPEGLTLLRRGLEAVQSMVRQAKIPGKDLMGYELYHPAFREHVHVDRSGIIGQQNPITRGEFCELAMQWPEIAGDHPAREYAMRFAVRHLIESERWEAVESLLTDIFFLETRNHAGQVFELASDFGVAVAALPEDRPQRHILSLLKKAFGRDIHFIARHCNDYPQALFQCLWNSGWWYDCEELSSHCAVAPEAKSNEEKTNWIQPEDQRLCRLLERWRDQKEQTTPNFPWLRSLRPPPIHLGSAQLAVLRGHDDKVSTVAFSPDGDRIVSGYDDGTVRVWDALSCAELAVLPGHKSWASSVAFSPDGDQIVSGYDDGTVRVWDAKSGGTVAVLSGHKSLVSSVAFSPDGNRIVSESDDGTVRLWNAQSGKELAVPDRHKSGVTSAEFSADTIRIAIEDDHTVQVWDRQSDKQPPVLRGHERTVSIAVFSPDEDRIASWGSDKAVRVWNALDGKKVTVLRGHEDTVSGVVFSPHGNRIVSESDDGTVRLWDAHSGKELAVLCGHGGTVSSVAFSPDENRIASWGSDKAVRVWNALDGKELAVLRGHKGTVESVAFSSDGNRIAGAAEETVVVWDTQSGEKLAVLCGHKSPVESIAFSSDGNRIVSESDDGTVRVWEPQGGEERPVLRGHEDSVNSVSLPPDGNRTINKSHDGTLRLWDAQSGKELAVLCGHKGPVECVAFSPDGDRIVSGYHDGTVRVWDAQGGEERPVLRGHERCVDRLVFSPSGDRIATGSSDGTVRLWNALNGEELAVLPGHERSVKHVTFSPEGHRITSWSADKTVRVWDTATGKCIEVILPPEDVPSKSRRARSSSRRARKRRKQDRTRPLETVRPIDWFPDKVADWVAHPSGRTWAGSSGNHFYIITLEGGQMPTRPSDCQDE